MAAVEQRHVGVLLQRPDAVGDGGRGDAELLGGEGEPWWRAAASKKRRLSSGGRKSTRENLRTGRHVDNGIPALPPCPRAVGRMRFFGSILFSHSENYLI